MGTIQGFTNRFQAVARMKAAACEAGWLWDQQMEAEIEELFDTFELRLAVLEQRLAKLEQAPAQRVAPSRDAAQG
jgi:hypothetical protein